VPSYSQLLCSNLNFHSPIGGVVLVVVDVAVAWIKLPHNALVASLAKTLLLPVFACIALVHCHVCVKRVCYVKQ